MQSPTYPSTYFFSFESPFSKEEILRIYQDIKPFESKFEAIHNSLPHPSFFDEIVYIYISSYQPVENIIQKLNEIEAIIQLNFSIFQDESIEHKNIFLDGFFTLMVIDKRICECTFLFFKELYNTIPFIKDFTVNELRDIFKIAHYYSQFPEDKIRPFESYKHTIADKKYLFDSHDFFLHLFIHEINPVLLTDNFFRLSSTNDFEALHLLLNGVKDLNTTTLHLDLNEKEYELLSSENHPPLIIHNIQSFGIENIINCVKGLLSINLPSEMIYRIYFEFKLARLRIPNKQLIDYINEYILFLKRQPTLSEIHSFLKFQHDIPVNRKYPLFSTNEVRFLYKKEMSLYFKQNLSVFTDNCQHCESLNNSTIKHIEWIDENSQKQYANYCNVCLEEKNFRYIFDFDPPF